MSTSPKPYLPVLLLLLLPIFLTPLSDWAPLLPIDEIPSYIPGSSHPQHHLAGTEQRESRERAMGKEWETNWMPGSNSITRRICRSPAFHNCRWSKMDVGRIPFDRKSKKCQRSHGEWIVLFLSGNVIYFLLSDQRCFFMLWECGGKSLRVYRGLVSALRHWEGCVDIQLIFIQGHTVHLGWPHFTRTLWALTRLALTRTPKW